MKVANVIETMASIVEKRLVAYKDDFYHWDLKTLSEERPAEFVWLLRPTGTELLHEDDPKPGYWTHCYELFGARTKWFYHVRMNEDGSGEVTLSRKRCDGFAARMGRKERMAA